MPTAIILAGGLGTRLRSVVADVPKPMASIEGRPFLEYQLDYWISRGISHFILAVGYKHEVISAYFGSTYHGAKLTYSIEDTPLGTGGGFLLALKKTTEDLVLLLNGDTFFDIDFKYLETQHREKSADVTFSVFRTFEAGRYMGMDIDKDGRVKSLATNNSELGRLANGGVYLVKTSAIMDGYKASDAKVSLEDDIFPGMVNNRAQMFSVSFEGRFIDIGVPSDYQRAAEVLCSHGGNS